MDDRRKAHFFRLAQSWADLSHANKLKVGAVAVRDGRSICEGYNGTLPGDSNVCEDWVYDEVLGRHKWKTRDEVEHAERNLIAYAAKEGIALKGAVLFVTHSPCIQCARMIRNVGIKEVYYGTPFSHTEGLEYLQRNGVPCHKREAGLGGAQEGVSGVESPGGTGEQAHAGTDVSPSGSPLPPPW